jgi:hypothetical protein
MAFGAGCCWLIEKRAQALRPAEWPVQGQSGSACARHHDRLAFLCRRCRSKPDCRDYRPARWRSAPPRCCFRSVCTQYVVTKEFKHAREVGGTRGGGSDADEWRPRGLDDTAASAAAGASAGESPEVARVSRTDCVLMPRFKKIEGESKDWCSICSSRSSTSFMPGRSFGSAFHISCVPNVTALPIVCQQKRSCVDITAHYLHEGGVV